MSYLSYHRMLLEQPAPLEPHEVGVLRGWLVALEWDCDQFGATDEDRATMDAIRARIRKAQENAADG